MKRMIAITVWVFSTLLTSCTWQRTSFIDSDGTKYDSTIMVGPFNKLDAGQAAFAYAWNIKTGDAKVTANQAGNNYDNTAQTALVEALIAAGMKLGAAGIAAGSQ